MRIAYLLLISACIGCGSQKGAAAAAHANGNGQGALADRDANGDATPVPDAAVAGAADAKATVGFDAPNPDVRTDTVVAAKDSTTEPAGDDAPCKYFTTALGGEQSTASAVVALADGFALFGTAHINQVPWHARLVRTDSSGHELWAKSYDGPYSAFGTSLVALSDGFAFAGSTSATADNRNQGWLVRTDPAGNVLWQQTFDSVYEETFFALAALPDGFAAAGRIENVVATGEQVSLRRTDLDGKLLWSASYGAAGDDVAYALVPTASGFAIAGTAGGVGDKLDAWLIATDKNGMKLWDKTYGDTLSQGFAGMAATADGFVLVGAKGGGTSSLWVVRTDAAGAVVWERTYSGSGGEGWAGGARGVQVLPDGFAVAGRAYFVNTADAWLIRMDLMGNPMWDHHFGTQNEEAGEALAVVPDGFAMAGQAQIGQDWVDEMWLVRTDAWGNVTCAAGAATGK